MIDPDMQSSSTVHRIPRRAFLRRAAVSSAGLGALGLSGALVSAFEKTTRPASSLNAATKAATPFKVQLSWIENVEFAGTYLAKSNGYYTEQGLDVSLLSGGPSVTVEPLIVAGHAPLGLSSTVETVTAITKGADLRIIGTQYQTSPFVILSLASRPILNPKQMKGKTIGVAADNEGTWNTFLKLNGLTPSDVTTVPEQFDPTPLADGQVDGWLGFSTDEQVTLEAKGVHLHSFSLEDYGYKVLDSPYLVTTSTLADPAKRALVVSFMKAEMKGWNEQIANPAAGARLTVDVYGKNLGLSLSEQTLQAKAQNALFTSSDTRSNGLFWMSAARQQATADTLATSGIHFKPADVFSLEVLREIHG